MIDVTSLTRYYGRTRAVDDVSFSIGDGSIVGLLGHNGAGKTTVMKMLSGYLEPSAGSIRIGGRDLEHERREIQRRLGYLPENLPIYPEMTIADYLDYAAALKGLRGADAQRAISHSVEATELGDTGGTLGVNFHKLGDRLLDPIGNLSRGFKQRVGVAQAILGDPALLILDEPGNGLDPEQNEHMRSLVKELSRSATVILSTHIMQEVDALCDRVLVLVSGRLALDENMEVLRASNRILLQVSGDGAPLAARLEQLPPVASVERLAHGADRAQLALTLRDGSTHEDVAAEVAELALGSGVRLFALQREQNDLEQIFRDALKSTEVSHVA